MENVLRSSRSLPVKLSAAFLGIFLVLYAGAVAFAELVLVRGGTDTAFQRLLAARGEQVDWIVLGASHALPLQFGGVPARLENDTGRSMVVLAEIGAGPLYNLFLFNQAVRDLDAGHLLYIVDSFTFGATDWNQDRVAERKLLGQTPLRLSTAAILAGLVMEKGVDPRALLDYLTGFSKLNPVERFPQAGWRGAADFDRTVRLSRHAVSSRLSYLYPDGAPKTETTARYLDTLEDIIGRARTNGIDVTVVKLPLPKAMREGLPGEAAFDRALAERLAPEGIPYHDLSAAMDGPQFFFDTDHLNRQGVDLLYRDYLRAILTQGW